MNFQFFSTKIGDIGIVEDADAVVRIVFGKVTLIGNKCDSLLLSEAHRQIVAYLERKLTVFSLPLDPRGTPFMKSVWAALLQIPYGTTTSYSAIAQAIGNSKASRAVGLANNRNPIPIIIPCHRVIGKNGMLIGYAGGLDVKRTLLEIEAGAAVTAP